MLLEPELLEPELLEPELLEPEVVNLQQGLLLDRPESHHRLY